MTPVATRRQAIIAVGAITGILVHLVLRFAVAASGQLGAGVNLADVPLLATLVFGGVPLVLELLGKLVRLEFGSDLLAGISIVTSLLLGEYLAGSLVVLMLSGGEALEAFAVRNASSVLDGPGKADAFDRPSPSETGTSRTSPSRRSRSETSWSSSRTKPAPLTARWSKGTA